MNPAWVWWRNRWRRRWTSGSKPIRSRSGGCSHAPTTTASCRSACRPRDSFSAMRRAHPKSRSTATGTPSAITARPTTSISPGTRRQPRSSTISSGAWWKRWATRRSRRSGAPAVHLLTPISSSLESRSVMRRISVAILATAALLSAQPFTRGVGVYPGDPAQDFAPALAPDSTYRNIALRRPAYQSSAYDYNLTAQLVTDGIKETALPRWLSTTTSQGGVARKNERELLVDHNMVTTVSLRGAKVWVQFELAGGEAPLEVDRIEALGNVQANAQLAAGWNATVSGSDDGQSWNELGRANSGERPGREFHASIAFRTAAHARFYRLELEAASAVLWRLGEVTLYRREARVEIGGPYRFSSAWMSAGSGQEWVYVDLGAAATFDRIKLFWLRRAA